MNNEGRYQRRREYYKDYYIKNRERILLVKKKKWRKDNPEVKRIDIPILDMREYRRKWRVKNKEKIRRWHNEWRKENKISVNLAKGINKSLKGRGKDLSWQSLVGYSLSDLKKRLECQFDENMSWDNYGSYWHVDHKKPKSLFDFQSPKDQSFKDCWCLANLQPLEKGENHRKGNRYIG